MNTKIIVSKEETSGNNFLYPLGKAGDLYLFNDYYLDFLYVRKENGAIIKIPLHYHSLIIYLEDRGFIEIDEYIEENPNDITIARLYHYGELKTEKLSNSFWDALTSNIIVVYSEFSSREIYYIYNKIHIMKINLRSKTTEIYERFDPEISPRITSREDIAMFNSLIMCEETDGYSPCVEPINCSKSGKLYYLGFGDLISSCKEMKTLFYYIFDENKYYLGRFVIKVGERKRCDFCATDIVIHGRYLYHYLDVLYIVDLETIQKPKQITQLDTPNLREKVDNVWDVPTSFVRFDITFEGIISPCLVSFTPEEILVGGNKIVSMRYFHFSAENFRWLPNKVKQEIITFLLSLQVAHLEVPRELRLYILTMLF